MTEQWVKTPYDEGFHARQKDEPATANPYRVGSIDRRKWREGWLDLDHHFRTRDECIEW